MDVVLQMKKILGEKNDVVIVCEIHKSICKAIEVVFPNVLHCMCIVHLLRNLKLRYKRIVDIVFHACGKASNALDLNMRCLNSNLMHQVYAKSWNQLIFLRCFLVRTHPIRDIR